MKKLTFIKNLVYILIEKIPIKNNRFINQLYNIISTII